MKKTLIMNGTIIDGTGQERFISDVILINDKIHSIQQVDGYDGSDFDIVIDANKCVISPGFIDTHSHSDLKILVDPYMDPKITQGVTTEILGQDGISMAPLPRNYIELWRKNLSGLEGDSEEIPWDYDTTEGYFQLLEKSGIGLNESYLVPHGNIRMEVMGLDYREPTEVELQKMKEILKREINTGALGMSTGLIYIPCLYSKTKELIELGKVVAENNGMLVIHQRSEADTILESMDEVFRISKESGVKIHFSHMKVAGKKNRDKFNQVLELLDKAKSEGIQISFDQYPYIAGSTMMGVLLPPWAHEGGMDKLLVRLLDPKLREKMKYDMINGLPGWDNFVDFAGLDQIYVTSVKTSRNQGAIGKSLIELGTLRGQDPFEALFDLLFEEENAVGMVDFYGCEEHIVGFMKRPEQNFCTDGLLGGKPHPRVYGTFPRVLGKYVREKQVLTLEEAVRKMTGKPAEIFGLTGRGILRKGNFADLVIFDPLTIKDQGSYIQPDQYPTGIEYVFVNGECVINKGKHTRVKAGRILKKER